MTICPRRLRPAAAVVRLRRPKSPGRDLPQSSRVERSRPSSPKCCLLSDLMRGSPMRRVIWLGELVAQASWLQPAGGRTAEAAGEREAPRPCGAYTVFCTAQLPYGKQRGKHARIWSEKVRRHPVLPLHGRERGRRRGVVRTRPARARG